MYVTMFTIEIYLRMSYKYDRDYFTTKFGNNGIYHKNSGLRSPPSTEIIASDIISFVSEANELPYFKGKKEYESKVTLSFKNNSNNISTCKKNPKNLVIRSLSNGYPNLFEKSIFTKINLPYRRSYDTETRKALQNLLKTKTNIHHLIIPHGVENLWEFINYGYFLKQIWIDSYGFRGNERLPQFYKLNYLMKLTLTDSIFDNVNTKYMERRSFKSLVYTKLKSFKYSYEFEYLKNLKSTKIVTRGTTSKNMFKENDNFQQLFNFNYLPPLCNFDFQIQGKFTKRMCRLYLTKVLTKLHDIKLVDLPWSFFHENKMVHPASLTFIKSLKQPINMKIFNNNSYF